MPCTYTGSIEGDRAMAAAEKAEKLTEVTAMLCEACKLLDRKQYTHELSQKTINWWYEHKKLDKELERESLRKSGLSKLSLAEIKALGIV